MSLRLVAICLLAALLGGCIAVNRFHVPADQAAAVVSGSPADALAGQDLRLVTWNIGYGGMGQESDFKLDGGEQTRPLSKGLVERNLAAISDTLARFDADVILLQEVARPSFSTYQIDVLEALVVALPGTAYTFDADIRTRWVPPPIRSVIGNATFSRRSAGRAETRGLALEQTFQYGLFRKGYRMHVLYLDGPMEWVIINIHLAAFDSAGDGVRERQLKQTLEFAAEQYAAGRYVIIGGDWNLRLAPTRFPHQTQQRDLFWIRDLDPMILPADWTLATDMAFPTVRTANAPYIDGVNYRLIIDGFLLSPNIELIDVRTHDLNFEHTDHNPVWLEIRARQEPG